MSTNTDLFLTRTTDGKTIVSLPEQALSESQLDAARDKLLGLATALSEGELHLDFARVQYLGSSALGVLVALHRKIEAADGHLVLVNLAPDLVELFRLTRLDGILDIRPAASEAG